MKKVQVQDLGSEMNIPGLILDIFDNLVYVFFVKYFNSLMRIQIRDLG